jgi:hypothetical protein
MTWRCIKRFRIHEHINYINQIRTGVNPKIKYLRKKIEARQIGSYVIIVYDFSSFIILSEEKKWTKNC